MARAIQALKSCIRPCQNGSGHSGTQVMQLAVPEWLEPFLHSSHATGRVRMARAIMALKFGQWHYLRARMARAILALPIIHNGLSHSGTQVMQLAVPEWLEPFLHSSHATAWPRVGMARAILALKSCNLHGCAIMARAILASRSASGITCVQEWLEPFWHCQQYLSAIIA